MRTIIFICIKYKIFPFFAENSIKAITIILYTVSRNVENQYNIEKVTKKEWMQNITGEKLSLIKVAISIVIYWSVRSFSKREH